MAFSNEYLLLVDIKRRLSSVVPSFKQGDNGVLKFEIYDNGKKYDLSGYTYSEITFRLPSGTSIVGNPTLESNGVLTYKFTGVEMSEVGRIETILSIYNGSTMVSIQPFFCFIYDSMKGEDLSYIGILQDLIAEVQIFRTEVMETVEDVTETLTEANLIKEEVSNLNTFVTLQEQTRESNEKERKTNETTRKNNELSRDSNEQIRIKNEKTRETNENNRLQSLDSMDSIINQFKTTGAYNSSVTYKRYNQVEVNGSTYIALIDNTNVPITNTSTWRLYAKKGEKGDTGETGAALSILGSLTNVSQLPPSGNSGDAYTVNGELYVWSENTKMWENVGNIKGEKGNTGDTGQDGESAYEIAVNNGFIGSSEEWLASLKGVKGDAGKDADLTEINQQVGALQSQVAEHKTDNDRHLNTGERSNWNSKTDDSKIASSSVLGHVKVGENLTITPDGTLNASSGTVPDATEFVKGIVQLNDSLTSTSTSFAATTNSVRKVNDKIGLTPSVQVSPTSGWEHDTGSLGVPLTYYRDMIGNVYLQGGLTRKTGGISASTLPIGFRPTSRIDIPALFFISGGGTVIERLNITPSGVINAYSSSVIGFIVNASFRTNV